MPKPYIILLVALLILSATAARAINGGYIIGPGDVLTISVYDEPDLERTVTVQSDGLISIPLLRAFPVGGLSIAQAERELEKALGQSFLVDPQVSITVKEYHAQKVYVLGAVRNPGLFSLTGPTTVLEIVSKAGGLAPDGSRRFMLLRGGGKSPNAIKSELEKNPNPVPESTGKGDQRTPIMIDGRKLLDEGDTTQNYLLQDGDVVYVPKLQQVYVLGEVRRPGAVPFTEGLTLLQAISQAGGTTEMARDATQVTRKVGGEEKRFDVDLGKILKNTKLDLQLEPEDVIVVKRRWL